MTGPTIQISASDHPDGGWVRDRYKVQIQQLDPIPCPSPWRHPLAWLRWNPLLRVRRTLVLPNCAIGFGGPGGVTITPLPTEPEESSQWWIDYGERP